jgi:flagellar protein FlaG
MSEDSGEAIVRVVDKETNQVVRQIPGQEMLAIRRALDRLQGILIRVKA